MPVLSMSYCSFEYRGPVDQAFVDALQVAANTIDSSMDKKRADTYLTIANKILTKGAEYVLFIA